MFDMLTEAVSLLCCIPCMSGIPCVCHIVFVTMCMIVFVTTSTMCHDVIVTPVVLMLLSL